MKKIFILLFIGLCIMKLDAQVRYTLFDIENTPDNAMAINENFKDIEINKLGLSSAVATYANYETVKSSFGKVEAEYLRNTDDTMEGYLGLYNRTLNELKSITPTAEGQMYWCSDQDAIFISTGTTEFAFKKTTMANPE